MQRKQFYHVLNQTKVLAVADIFKYILGISVFVVLTVNCKMFE